MRDVRHAPAIAAPRDLSRLADDAPGGAGGARRVLDHLRVPGRLEHVRAYVWRGGSVRFEVEAAPFAAGYELAATWETAVLVGAADAGIASPGEPGVVVGRWRRSLAGYWLRVGFEAAVPSAIVIRSPRRGATPAGGPPAAFVPFVGRPREEVERALSHALAEYARAFLDGWPPVPQAAAEAQRRLLLQGL